MPVVFLYLQLQYLVHLQSLQHQRIIITSSINIMDLKNKCVFFCSSSCNKSNVRFIHVNTLLVSEVFLPPFNLVATPAPSLASYDTLGVIDLGIRMETNVLKRKSIGVC